MDVFFNHVRSTKLFFICFLCLSGVYDLGNMIERILVSCNNQQDLHEWVDHLQKQTKVTTVGNPTIKPHSVPSHTVRKSFWTEVNEQNYIFWQRLHHGNPFFFFFF